LPLEKAVKKVNVKKAPVVAKSVPKPAPVPSIGGESARDFIFRVESGNTLHAKNGIGCYGLGQDCNDVLAGECPNWRTDRPCQERFWESYMQRRYGSWEAAKAFWQARVPINGKDVGNWW